MVLDQVNAASPHSPGAGFGLIFENEVGCRTSGPGQLEDTLSDDKIHIIPAEEQSAEEVAEILTTVAAAQGLEDEVYVEGDQVIVPRSLHVTFQGNARSFPPVNQNYVLQEPVQLYNPGTTAAEGQPIGTLGVST